MIARAHIAASHIIAEKIPPIVDDVMTRAAPQRLRCQACQGASANGGPPCLACFSLGYIQTEPDLDRQKLALELAQLTEKKGGLFIQQNTGVVAAAALPSNSGALEQLQQAVGDLLFRPGRRRAQSPPEREPEPAPEIIRDEPIDIPPAPTADDDTAADTDDNDDDDTGGVTPMP